MSFTSIPFFLFLPLVFCLHWSSPRRNWQNGILVAASYFFYGWWDYRFCFLMLASSLNDFLAGWWIDRLTKPSARKRVLVLSLGLSLAMLGFFKYFNFFAESLALALSVAGWDVDFPTLNIILPVGISFYTFQTMSYTLDIYFRKCHATTSLLDYLAFVSFFPQLVAGPIMRATELLPQFHAPRVFSASEAREGCRLMLWGLAKKMVLADNLGAIVDAAYRTPASMGGAELALATVCFAFQIYCDFSAYSDLAVGAAKLFNLPLKRNFAYPYFSQSLSEFWRRWHISLSTWLRDYVYIPLGGNRGSRGLTARNLLLTALTSGLWHGAAWHFVVWGWLHGIYLVAGRIVHPVPKVRTFPAVPGGEQNLPGPGTVLRMVLVFSLVCLAWVPFRAASLADAAQVYGKIVSQIATAGFYVAWSSLVRQHLVVLLFLGAFVVIEWLSRRNWNTFAVARAPLLVRWCAYSGLFWVILCFGTRRTEDFIYFRF